MVFLKWLKLFKGCLNDFHLSRSLRVLTTVAEKSQQRKREAAGHMVFTVRKQRGMSAIQLVFPFYSVTAPNPWNDATHI